MNTLAPFLIECPKCKRDRALRGYSNDELAALLNSGADIEGYCMSCDELWSISTEERAEIAHALSRRT